ncbi:protein of unknown function [Sterolibacterium denitrificans]|uniref:Uncharacterized protein n=1 Tax=Sterolibacterium denitrificans TaxID=157592 RepID=A0A7Z7HPL3_9PROT|nr:protein of unknown function [Sterolibacterium denitrificans]
MSGCIDSPNGCPGKGHIEIQHTAADSVVHTAPPQVMLMRPAPCSLLIAALFFSLQGRQQFKACDKLIFYLNGDA